MGRNEFSMCVPGTLTEGWADDAKRLAAQGDDALVWPELANEGDDKLVW
jgi:hypothetical protein